ncbi:hypothetical protein SAMN05720487_10980 [Fibrobacter sp. UWT2]|uniref:hypothetical protein n=1 Tax=Fibrobacter sp. UWT2 TaxID=1896224 RepID=UPI0009104E93|nr:hypothetical protein [Fibrobacter sp. UWT2]SHL20521.1 hypothetical protein SAMN05720487_10980 [Fibrobacter sp. UWT2]
MTFAKNSVCIALIAVASSFAADRVVGANATLDIEPGARSAALGSATMAVDGDYLGLMSNPYQLANVNYAWASFSHTEYYEDTKYDYASAVVPLGAGQGLGISFSRFGADDIPYIKEGEPLPEGSNYNTLSIADWVFSATFGRKLTDRLELGVGFHGLYRDMDQTGWGFRGDAGLRFRAVDELYVSGLLKGWTSSATSWESGEFEYTSPEFYLAASYGLPVPYLYGKLNVYWQGAGLFHREARDLDFETDESRGKRVWEDPLDWLSGGRGGLEYTFDFGLSLRAGLSSFTTLQSVTAGAGLVIAKFVKVDYAFESHPVLSPVHRVSVSISPYLFSHAPRQGTPEVKASSKAVVAEEPEESDAAYEAMERESYESPAAAETPAATESSAPSESAVEELVPAPEQVQNRPEKPNIVETDDEVLEP